MAMRTASPWWASLAFGIGLLLVFVSERLLAHQGGMRVALTGLGVGLIIAVTGARVWTTVSTHGARRNVERTLLLCHVGTLVALMLYALTTKWGMNLVGATSARYAGGLTVVWAILLVASMIPVLIIELSLGTALRTNFDVERDAESEDSGVEYYRVREIGWSGLTIALALALLMVTCRVAKERNVQRDVSYFKTSAAGDSTKAIITASSELIKAHLFFPDPNEVKEQVRGYFETLASTGKLQIEVHDRFVDAELASKYKVTKDGVIVLSRGKDDEAKKEKEKFFTIEVDTDIEKARKGASKLRNLDREVNSVLMKLAREKRKAYVMTGHGEMNDPDSVPPEQKGRTQEWQTTKFKQRLGDLNYEVKDLGLIDLAKDVPDDATIVFMLAPTQPLLPAELDALDRYLARGGKILIALDPKSDPNLGVLEGRLGVKMNRGAITDDVAFLPQRGSPADRRLVITTQFSAHPSTTALSRSVDKGLLLIEGGALEDVPFKTTGEAPKKTITIRSMESSWLDTNDNFAFDPTGPAPEKKQRWNIGAAIEGPKQGDKDGFRALVFSDSQLFADLRIASPRGGGAATVLISGPLLDDAVRWLGGEEVFSGEIVSEDDKPIKHTKNQDAVWFTLTTVGAPLLVLTLGLVGTWFRRRRRPTKTEVTP